jgi:hypothetical protein
VLHLQPILLWLFGDGGLENYFPKLTSDLDPPDLSLPSTRITGVSHWHWAFHAFVSVLTITSMHLLDFSFRTMTLFYNCLWHTSLSSMKTKWHFPFPLLLPFLIAAFPASGTLPGI